MNEETAFREAMRADPNDHITRRVYADWLDEHGKHEAARRIRWWVAAKEHLDAGPTSGSAVRTNEHHTSVERQMPEWLARLNQVRGVRKMWANAPAGRHAGALDALHEAELHAYGLHSADDFDLARHRARNIRPEQLRPEGVWAHEAPNALLQVNAHNQIRSPVYAALRHAHPEAYGAPLAPQMAEHNYDTQRLRDYMRDHPHDQPVKLARPLSWIRDKVSALFGGKEPVRQPGDGIVHTRDNPTAVYAEHNAVAQAIRLLGGSDHTARAGQYMNWVHGFVKAKPDHPLVRAYVDAAKMSGGTAGPELTAAVKPLVGAVNLLMAAHGKDSRFVKPVSEATPTLPPVRTSATPDELPYEVVPDAPVDLSDAPAPTEDAHAAIMRMTKDVLAKKATRDDIVKHLMETHGVPTRAAALARIRNAINRAKILNGRPKGPTKLAAYTSGAIKPEHLVGKTAARDPYTGVNYGFHPAIEGSSLAHHLRQIQKDRPDLHSLADAALTGRSHYSGRANASASGVDDPFVHLGRALKKDGHPLADAHDWDRMSEHLTRDAVVKKAVEKLVQRQEGHNDLQFWNRVAIGADRSKNSAQFWERLENMLGGKHGDRTALRESLHRINDRLLDKAYLEAVRDEGVKANPEWKSLVGK